MKKIVFSILLLFSASAFSANMQWVKHTFKTDFEVGYISGSCEPDSFFLQHMKRDDLQKITIDQQLKSNNCSKGESSGSPKLISTGQAGNWNIFVLTDNQSSTLASIAVNIKTGELKQL